MGEDIPTSEKRDPVWREDIQTSENCVLDLRHIIPTWGWSAPDSGQAIPTQGRLVHNLAHIILTHRCYSPLLEHTGLYGDRADDGADDEHTGVRNFVYANSRSAEFANSAAVSCEFVIRF